MSDHLDLTTQQKKLIEAILFDRRNNEPKEAYAVWLEKHGDKHQADYIREKVRKAVDDYNAAAVQHNMNHPDKPKKLRRQDCTEPTSLEADMKGSRGESGKKFEAAVISFINSPELGLGEKQVHLRVRELLRGEPYMYYPVYFKDADKIPEALMNIASEPVKGAGKRKIIPERMALAVVLAMGTSSDGVGQYQSYNFALQNLDMCEFSKDENLNNKRKAKIANCVYEAAVKEGWPGLQTMANRDFAMYFERYKGRKPDPRWEYSKRADVLEKHVNPDGGEGRGIAGNGKRTKPAGEES